METITYKCPNCDGGLVFDPGEQKFKCEYCQSEFTEEELLKLKPEESQAVPQETVLQETASQEEEAQETARETPDQKAPEEDDRMMVYSCPSCGAEIVADETTASSFCYYCHNPVVLSGRLSGEYRPDFVLPFVMDKGRAETVFKEWIGRKRYVPRDFYSPGQLKLLEGIYYPYWLYSCQVEGKLEAEAARQVVSRLGSMENIETSYYNVSREGTMEVKNMAKNALKKADRQLAEAVLPFDMEKLLPFSASYLSGFRAERRDFEKQELEPELEAELHSFAAETLKEGITGYDSVTVKRHEEQFTSPVWSYALLPVWVLTYRRKDDGKTYYFAMNGQSGKICGILPVDYKRLAVLFASIFVPLFFLFLLGGYLL